MRLVNAKSHETVVEFNGPETIFHNKYLEKQMKQLGVLIPHGLRGEFGGKECIYLGDPLFQKAFKEVYTLTLDPAAFHWHHFTS